MKHKPTPLALARRVLTRAQTTRKAVRGFTLIELMVGMTVGVLVLGTLTAVFVPSLTTYKNTQAISEIQESERYALNVLSRSIEQAGYIGCDSRVPAKIVNVTPIPQSAVAWTSDLTQPIRLLPATPPNTNTFNNFIGSNDDDIQRLTDLDNTTPIGDVISVVTSGGGGVSVLDSHNTAAQTLTFRGNQTANLSAQFILLNDCSITTLVRLGTVEATAYDANTNTTTLSYAHDTAPDDINCQALDSQGQSTGRVYLGGSSDASCADDGGKQLFRQYTFAPETHATRLSSTAFYLANANSTDATDDLPAIPSLFSISINADGTTLGAPTLLIAGVENLRARYLSVGETAYKSATDFINPDNAEDVVLSLELSLLIRSSVRGRVSGDTTQELEFPGANGELSDCSDASADVSACPKFINENKREQGRYRRVVKKIFNLRNPTS